MNEGGQPVVYFVAGEASGDRHAAELLRSLKAQSPGLRAKGVGGPHLRSAGQEQLFDLAAHAVVGLTEVLKNYFKFRSFFNRVLSDMAAERPDVLILVDYPGFNLRLARAVRNRWPELLIVYYISPQVWAWKSGRARTMQQLVDLLLVIFPFEKPWFAKHAPRLNVEWIGHPTLDRWNPDATDTTVKSNGASLRLALLPGSRVREITAHLPILLETARMTVTYRPGTKFTLLAADDKGAELLRGIITQEGAGGLDIDIQQGYQLTHLSRCDIALVASGTASLECCLARLPMLVLYKVSPLTAMVARRVIKLPYVSMVNVLAGEKVVPEFLQERATPEALFEAVKEMITRPAWRVTMQKKLEGVARMLGEPGASARAAREVLKLMASRSSEPKPAVDQAPV
jgi:lipid-A-disaccharide synthase